MDRVVPELSARFSRRLALPSKTAIRSRRTLLKSGGRVKAVCLLRPQLSLITCQHTCRV